MPAAPNNPVLRQLQLVFTLSTLLLLVSLVASFYSIRQLIRNSELVNHTNEVLSESEAVMSLMKDAETGQRGFLVTQDPVFLQPYIGSREKINASFERLATLMRDSPDQEKNLTMAKALANSKFAQMQRVIDLTRRRPLTRRDTLQHAELIRGKQVMDELRVITGQIKANENQVLQTRLQQQQFYITYTPLLLVVAALISVLITLFAYVRIKTDLDERMAEQQLAEAKYTQTAQRITAMERVTQVIAGGDYTARSTDTIDDELGRIASALNQMGAALQQTFTDLTTQNWLQAGSVSLNEAMRGERIITKLANRLIAALTNYLEAPLGTIYIADSDAHTRYKLAGHYAAHHAPASLAPGEGLVGQVIKSQQTLVVQQVPAGYLPVQSSLGATLPTALLIAPLVYDGACLGAIELGLLAAPSPLAINFLERNLEPMAIAVNAALDYARLQHFLEETQAQAEELQAQHTELETLNADLEMQAQKLQASEEELRVQQEELQQTNTELEERGLLLEERNDEIQRKADELELATRYKSEFLANMSHELRTPLNSILLLSRLLAENNEQNLSPDQIEYATVIQASGNGLLGLIDEILDLSKIEAGQMTLDYQPVAVTDITDELQALFGLVAREKGLDLTITTGPDVAPLIHTDKMRLGQILKNLLANALKFTAAGSVSLTIEPDPTWPNTLNFVVHDTGIGIAPEKQRLVFEAFQQADGSTKRKYGGTGLGLSISRELAKLLGGDISLKSQLNQGSTFTLRLPVSAEAAVTLPEKTTPPNARVEGTAAANPSFTPATPSDQFISPLIPDAVPDDRQLITAQDRVILIVEDDTLFAKSLLDYARRQGYKGIVAVRGDDGLNLAIRYKPLAILLDIQLPVMSGWEVMDALKANSQTRPIPVHIMSSYRMKSESRFKGAIDFVDKPVAFEQMEEVFARIEQALSQETRKVLIIEDNPKHAKALAYFLETFNINSELRSNITEGIDALKRHEVECVILDMGVPDHKAYETLEAVKQNPGLENLPIIIFTGKSLSLAEELKIRKYADSIIVKTAHSYQRMLDEVSLFLHLVEENKQQPAPANTKKLGALNQVLAHKTVLIADDDVRNIFSLSKALEHYQMNVVAALDGKEALQKLSENLGIDVVLLDMMMPQLDGYETTRNIRAQHRWKNLPVIAVTAKAMTGDRDKCIEAGASDYITKPVDIDQLLSLLRVWLYDRV